MAKGPLRYAVFSDGTRMETRGKTFTHALWEVTYDDDLKHGWVGYCRSAEMIEQRRRVFKWKHFEAVELRPVEKSE